MSDGGNWGFPAVFLLFSRIFVLLVNDMIMSMENVNINAGILRSALQIASRLLDNRTINPAFQLVELVANPSTLTLTAMNELIRFTIPMEAESDSSFSYYLKPAVLLNALKELPSETLVQLRFDESTKLLKGRYSNGSFQLPFSTSCPSYPREPAFHENETVTNTLPADQLHTICSLVKPYLAVDQLHRLFYHALFHFTAEGSDFVAHDGDCSLIRYRLKSSAQPARFLLPLPAVVFLGQLGIRTGQVDISSNGEYVRFTYDACVVICRLNAGLGFPRYNQMFDMQSTPTVLFDRNTIIGAAKRLSVFFDQIYPQIHCSFDPGCSEPLLLRVNDRYSSDYEEEHVPCKYEGNRFKVIFDADMLIRCLRSIPTDTLSFRVTSDCSPAIFESETEDAVISVLLMPMSA